MLPFGNQWQSANVAIMRLGHVVCFSDVYYPILRHIVANKGDNLNRRPGLEVRKQPIIAPYFESENELQFYNLEACFWQTNQEMAKKKNHKKCYFLNFKVS